MCLSWRYTQGQHPIGTYVDPNKLDDKTQMHGKMWKVFVLLQLPEVNKWTDWKAAGIDLPKGTELRTPCEYRRVVPGWQKADPRVLYTEDGERTSYPAGWHGFTTREDAEKFARYLSLFEAMDIRQVEWKGLCAYGVQDLNKQGVARVIVAEQIRLVADLPANGEPECEPQVGTT